MNPTENDTGAEVSSGHSANPGYALGQLAAALATQESGSDPDMRARAAEKAKKWLGVLTGMLSGSLGIGSRTPMKDVPAWATPEVVQGGFATGALMAAGPLRPHEQALLARLGGSSEQPRAALNHHYLGDAGFAELRRMLASGHYRVDVPEEGALLAVAWLLGNGHADAAQAVLAEIAPLFPTLRFYPVPSGAPLPDGSVVHLRTVGETVEELRAIRAPRGVLVQREALLVWAPLADRTVELFLETVEGPAPVLETGADGRPLRGETGRHVIDGGWPCQHYPEGWRARALALLGDYRRLRAEHSLSARPDRGRESFAKLRRYLEICVADPARLTGRDVGMIRMLLAMIATRRGLPGSERLARVRRAQAAIGARPTREELARVVIHRMDGLPPDDGLASLDAVLAPVSADEAAAHGVPEGHPVAAFAERRVRRSLAAPPEELVELGIISSGESLARVIPAITAQVRAEGLPDPELRRLYGAVYQAFRRRRSLLLLDLQSQVKTGELPWMQAMEARREGSAGTRELSRRALERVTTLAITAFPQQIIPNKLLRELRALADAAELRLPLVDELAADIFMDAFAGTFLRAAQAAGELLEGSLYERYYGISYARLRSIDDVKAMPYGGAPASAGFFQLCLERAEPDVGRSFVARNGTIIEQAQILTTHNLAVLFGALGLGETLRPRLGELASRSLAWICAHLQQPAPDYHTRLRGVKNAAYAWRQMIFYLSLAPEDATRAFLGWAKDHVASQPADFQKRFRPALQGLARAIDGKPVTAADEPDGARRFLGWTTGPHWLLRDESRAEEDVTR